MNFDAYHSSISHRFNSGISREHSYRGDLEALIHVLDLQVFADIDVQTLSYDMYAAHLHNDTLARYTRQEFFKRTLQSHPMVH